MARKDRDKLNIQVALKIKAPRGTRFSKKVLQQILDNLAANKPIPKSVEVLAISWQNPNRRGALAQWRWHTGADLRKVPTPRESSPRGSLQDAIETLGDSLSSGIVTF